MALRVNFVRGTLKELQSLPEKHTRQIADKISRLAADPASVPVKELKGGEGFFRAASGEYRIVFRIEGEELEIWLIARRNDDEVYRRFLRRR